ncbi:hydrolase, NUDIX family protein [Trichomonas vaginalis G3]|uniref:Hydrolase, NUDIX family protein n=1 Tax=Trichomonas vaginalis (strain ATCC PRA-98 / G3) TaxID=412133 RepID=A2DZ52_TRIV3|nr:m7G(5')pppN diphosphatase protein [Trichomonas vaginalis G3]EAY14328.1 hydrolase, NUDIX family protein [Trichomonas vaginalis G3]KAI5517354.1 m7G(5')pppN diphosphatase protein [Trichomonas vaginalis G3]|eukprot:XP_001326551.1 hydrolase, NUDIX family protein [Trichomonas vaginalis G3]
MDVFLSYFIVQQRHMNAENPYTSLSNTEFNQLAEVSEEEAQDILSRFFLNQREGFFNSILVLAQTIKDAYYYHLSVNRKFTLAQPKSLVTLFAANLFQYCDALAPYIDMLPDMFLALRKAHQDLLTCGTICLNSDLTKVMVIAHTITPHQFAFPKGKIDEGETPVMGAIRETEEETNFNVSQYIHQNHFFSYKRKSNSEGIFFFATDVPEIELKPALPQEICRIGWVDINTMKSDDGYEWTPDGPTALIFKNQLPAFVESQKLLNNSQYI